MRAEGIAAHPSGVPPDGDGLAPLTATLRELPPESRLTGGAAAALIFSMVLPWYQVYVARARRSRARRSRSSRGSRRRSCWWPPRCSTSCGRARSGGASTCRAATASSSRWPAAGCCALLIWRLFDKPNDQRADRPRSASTGASSSRCWPPARWWRPARGCAPRAGPSRPTRSPRSSSGRCRSAARASRAGNGRPREHTEVTQVLRERPPAWEGDAPEPPGRAERPRPPADEPGAIPPRRTSRRPTGCSDAPGASFVAVREQLRRAPPVSARVCVARCSSRRRRRPSGLQPRGDSAVT